LIWEGDIEELEEWFEKVIGTKNKEKPGYVYLDIEEDDIG